jgi:hypothetical protein
MIFHPADDRAIALWRFAAAFNANDAAACGALFGAKGELAVDATTTWHGAAEIEAGSSRSSRNFRGSSAPSSGKCAARPRSSSGSTKRPARKRSLCLLRVRAGLMPYDSAFMFDANDCIRTKETAYTPDGGSRFSTASLRPKAAW